MTALPRAGRRPGRLSGPGRALSTVLLGASLLGCGPVAAEELTAHNVRSLRLLASIPTGSPQAHQASPAVANGLVYVLTPFPHTLLAFRPSQDGLEQAWSFRPEPDRSAGGRAPADLSLAAPASADGALFVSTLDGDAYGLDPGTGAVRWRRRVADVGRGETLAAPPLASGGKLYLGNAGDAFGARGWLKALDARSGAELWTRASAGPDEDVGIGSAFRPFYGPERAPAGGVRSWPPGAWERGGGSVSGPLQSDPELGLVVHGTGAPAPADPEARPGDNRWTSGLFARDLATGEARWFTPIEPHDPYGYGATGPLLTLDRDWKGSPRKLLVHVGRNGYVYVLDRRTGEILAADAYAPVNASLGVDLATGRPRRGNENLPRLNGMARDVCPSAMGGVRADGAALSGATGLLYLSVNRLCMDLEPRLATYMPGVPYSGANIRLKRPPGTESGALVAWDIGTRKPAWTRGERFPLLGRALVTRTGLVVYGTLDGWLRALDARDGRLLWETKLPGAVLGAPVAFEAPDGRTRLAVIAGPAFGSGASVPAETDLRDATAARGLGNALRDLPAPLKGGAALLVFGPP